MPLGPGFRDRCSATDRDGEACLAGTQAKQFRNLFVPITRKAFPLNAETLETTNYCSCVELIRPSGTRLLASSDTSCACRDTSALANIERRCARAVL